MPNAPLLLADVCALPLEDASVDAIVSANVLEHVADDDGRAARDARVLRPGGRAAVVVPAGPGVYDYYDRFLGHERRYARGELAAKARAPGSRCVTTLISARSLYPPFWAAKKRNRRTHRTSRRGGQAPSSADIDAHHGRASGRMRERVERARLPAGCGIPFGIRDARHPRGGPHERHALDRRPGLQRGGQRRARLRAAREVLDGLGLDWEIIFSVDPSTDRTEERILALRERDPRVKMLRFSRRFGQPVATIAGLEAARGDAVVVIDCDLQDPPELIPEMVEQWREGYDVVYAQRRTREGETLVKRIVRRSATA